MQKGLNRPDTYCKECGEVIKELMADEVISDNICSKYSAKPS
jgi:hypothetical protein